MVAVQSIDAVPIFRLPLTGRCGDRWVLRGWAVVLDDDFGRVLLGYRWTLNNKGYAVRKRHIADGAGPVRLFLHQMVFEHYHGPIPEGLQIDHIDRVPLNDTPDNLRAVTQSQNMANRPRQRNNTSGFKGVHYFKQCRRWGAKVGVNGRHIYLGAFRTAEEAAAAVNLAYAHYHPHVPPPNKIG